MSSSGRRRFSMKHPAVVVDVGCSCRRSKLASFFSSFAPKPRFPNPLQSLSTSSSGAATSLWTSTANATTTTQSSSYSTASHEEIPTSTPPASKERRRRRRSKRTRKPASESVAVVKESSEPYADFRESMVQMIVENELYAWDDLNNLLHRFLSLNSPRHHHLILHAFADLWSGVFSPPSPCRWDYY